MKREGDDARKEVYRRIIYLSSAMLNNEIKSVDFCDLELLKDNDYKVVC